MPIEVESPEQLGYDTITNNLSESSVSDRRLVDLGLDLSLASGDGLDRLLLCYGDHLGDPQLREAIAAGGPGLRAEAAEASLPLEVVESRAIREAAADVAQTYRINERKAYRVISGIVARYGD